MSNITELAASIVAAHAGTTPMTSDELIAELQKIHTALAQLEGRAVPVEAAAEPATAMHWKKSIQPNQVICLVCGKGGMKTLTRHLAQVHDMKPGAYRKQFGIPSGQPLTAKKFSEARRQAAQERGLADNLAKARAIRSANIQEKKAAEEKKAAAQKAPVEKTLATKSVPKTKKK